MNSAVSLDRAQQVLADVFGFRQFRSHQADIIATVISGGDVLALMPTGGGKSLCYQIPALVRPGTGIVVSPLIALMQDQVEALTQARRARPRSSIRRSTIASRRRSKRRVAAGGLDLLYVSPERLLQERTLALLARTRARRCSPSTRRTASRSGVTTSGPNTASSRCWPSAFPNVPRIALTATADERTREEIVTELKLENARSASSPASTGPTSATPSRRWAAWARASGCGSSSRPSMPRTPASSTACRASRSRRRRRG